MNGEQWSFCLPQLGTGLGHWWANQIVRTSLEEKGQMEKKMWAKAKKKTQKGRSTRAEDSEVELCPQHAEDPWRCPPWCKSMGHPSVLSISLASVLHLGKKAGGGKLRRKSSWWPVMRRWERYCPAASGTAHLKKEHLRNKFLITK